MSITYSNTYVRFVPHANTKHFYGLAKEHLSIEGLKMWTSKDKPWWGRFALHYSHHSGVSWEVCKADAHLWVRRHGADNSCNVLAKMPWTRGHILIAVGLVARDYIATVLEQTDSQAETDKEFCGEFVSSEGNRIKAVIQLHV